MTRYFKYKTTADLRDDAVTLGHDIALSDDFSVLFEPVGFGRLTCCNRLAIQPMEGCDGTTDGEPDELTFRRYRRFGAGGAGLVWGEATAVTRDGRMNPRQLQLNPQTASSFAGMLEECRAERRRSVGDDNLIVGLQLTHSGRYAFEKPMPVMRDPLLERGSVQARLLTDDDLRRLEDKFVAAAKLAFDLGFQFVDLKQCHRYLMSELLSARHRNGDYGGSFENRTRFIRNIVGRLREDCPRLEIASRMNACDGVPFETLPDGTGSPVPAEPPVDTLFGVDRADADREDLNEPRQLARVLADAGVSLLNVTCGNPYANPHFVRPAEFPPVDGYAAPEHPLLGVLRHFRLTKAIREAVPEITVCGSGYSWLQHFAMHAAAANVAAGSVSIVGLGRATLSHPDFANHLKTHGAVDRKRTCRTFSYCTNLMRNKNHPLGQFPTGCPPFDKDPYDAVWKDARSAGSDETLGE